MLRPERLQLTKSRVTRFQVESCPSPLRHAAGDVIRLTVIHWAREVGIAGHAAVIDRLLPVDKAALLMLVVPDLFVGPQAHKVKHRDIAAQADLGHLHPLPRLEPVQVNPFSQLPQLIGKLWASQRPPEGMGGVLGDQATESIVPPPSSP